MSFSTDSTLLMVTFQVQTDLPLCLSFSVAMINTMKQHILLEGRFYSTSYIPGYNSPLKEVRAVTPVGAEAGAMEGSSFRPHSLASALC